WNTATMRHWPTSPKRARSPTTSRWGAARRGPRIPGRRLTSRSATTTTRTRTRTD
ncbi:MAG: hypothetical protein AVDCRST_MAG67-1912, partial [uncultured Solirubrobacteraceae bacterium]